MLKLGSNIKILDNSGATSAKIINLRMKKTYKSASISFNNVAYCVIKKHTTNKKLTSKNMTDILIIGVKKKNSRKNGCYINLRQNLGVPVVKKKHMYDSVATRIYTPITKELKKKRIFKQISLLSKQSF